MIDRLNLFGLALVLGSCGQFPGGGGHPSHSYCGDAETEEGALWRASDQYHVTGTPPELAHLLDASIRYVSDGNDQMVIEYEADGRAFTVVYQVANAR